MRLPRRRTLWLSTALLLAVIVGISPMIMLPSPVRANWTVWDALQWHAKKGAEKIGVQWD
jgi:hypothetical protein